MLPSKRILIFSAILILAVGAFILYSYMQNPDVSYVSTSTNSDALVAATSSSIDSTNSQVDSDHDGLPDWEEALYGTDPHNPDTDGDGTSDGKEVAEGRNPLVKGPNDYIAQKNNTATSSLKEKLTPTDVFAQDFFSQYAKLNQSGVAVTSDNASQIASDYLKSAPLPTIDAKQYTTNDLSLTNSDMATMRNYQASYIGIFTKYWPTDKNNNEMSILQQAFANNNPGALAGLSGVIAIYQNALNASLSLSVPKLAAAGHLNVVNSLSIYIKTLKMIQVAFTDPITGYVALNAFPTNQANLVASMANLRIYLINTIK